MALDANKATLDENSTVLFICDVQERFSTSIPDFNKVAANISKLIRALKILGIPMIACEHCPQLYGKTTSQIDLAGVKGPISKTSFSMCIPEVLNELETICNNKPPKSIILVGMATHSCVEMTAIDLKSRGYEVYLLGDCCSSSRQEDHLYAVERFRQMGSFVLTIENLFTKLMKDVKHNKFKEVTRILSSPSKI